jgi:RNA polymerase sigma-54 factor
MRSTRQSITVTQTQKLALNASLFASITLLRSDAAGLTRYLEEQASANPHLRLTPPPAPGLHDWLPRWSGVLQGSGTVPEAAGAAPSLIAHVMGAIDLMALPPRDRRIAFALTDALEPSGWLGQSLANIAAEVNASLPEVEVVLRHLQSIDPPGLFARNLSECLLLQAKDAGALDVPMAALLRNLDLLANGDLARLARICAISESEIMARFRTIRAMNPKPGADFAPIAAAQMREPDLITRALPDGGWSVTLNRSALPELRVDEGAAGAAPTLTAARNVVRMVEARNATLLAVACEILQRQQLALTRGPVALAPMTMADLAKTLGLHESTISRVVAGTGIDTPHGTWWLRHMFSAALGDEGGPQVSAAALRHRLARLIAAESPERPLSDAALSAGLTQETGVSIARRTVSKYREMQGIPAAHRRKRRHHRG